MRGFYTSVMGFRLHSEASFETETPTAGGEPTISFLTICELDTPLGRGGHPQMLVLIDHARHVFAKNRLIGRDPRRTTLNHLAFEIPPQSYEEEVQRLKQLGIEVSTAKFPGLNARAIFFADPEENALELISHYRSS